jgi:hypothetical protein
LGVDSTGLFGEDRPPLLEQHQQIGGTVEVDVDDGPDVFVRRRIKLFDEIDLTIEIAVRFAAEQDAAIVVLGGVGAAVPIAIERNFDETPAIVIVAPDVGSTIAIAVPGADVVASASRPDRRDCQERTRA